MNNAERVGAHEKQIRLQLMKVIFFVFETVLTHMAAASLCCSIEMEPRTLSEGQLNQAREIAGGIAKKFQRQEAEIIFTEGLKPIHSQESEMSENNQTEGMEKDTGMRSGAKEKARIMENPCQCASGHFSSSSFLEESSMQDQAIMLQEPQTAPF